MKVLGYMLTICLAVLASYGASELGQVRCCLDGVNAICSSNRWNYHVMKDAMNFECLSKTPAYNTLACSVSNDWRTVLQKLDSVATNDLERLLVIGVCKYFDEDFYISYLGVLSEMSTNNQISCSELSWAQSSTRYDLMSCLYRRYDEPATIDLVNKLIIAQPARTNRWNKILSGEAYTNYLEEVEAGLWQ